MASHIRDQNRPVGQAQGLFADRLASSLRIAQQVFTPLVGNRLGHPQQKPPHRHPLFGPHQHVHLFELSHPRGQHVRQAEALALRAVERGAGLQTRERVASRLPSLGHHLQVEVAQIGHIQTSGLHWLISQWTGPLGSPSIAEHRPLDLPPSQFPAGVQLEGGLGVAASCLHNRATLPPVHRAA